MYRKNGYVHVNLQSSPTVRRWPVGHN